jgi:16S rRNA (guanine527-N7)-methyltransferase
LWKQKHLCAHHQLHKAQNSPHNFAVIPSLTVIPNKAKDLFLIVHPRSFATTTMTLSSPNIPLESTLSALLTKGLIDLNIDLSAHQQERILQYVALLNKWNKVYNLTAVREPERMIGLHMLDSLAVLPHLARVKRVLDVGTGGGLPGIALAIARADMHVTMLDSLQKKTTFVRQAIGELLLTNAAVVCERVEQFKPVKKFDIVISRAFAELSDFVNGAKHLLADDGRMFAMKGVNPVDEIARLPAGFEVEKVIELNVPQVEGKRHLVVIKKV